MPAPVWILNAAGDLIDTLTINFIQRKNNSLVITFENGETKNYPYDSVALAQAGFSAYVAAIGPTQVLPDAPTALTIDAFSDLLSWVAPASGPPAQDYLLMWGTTPDGSYPNSFSIAPGFTSITPAAAGLDMDVRNYIVVVARNSSTAVSADSNEIYNLVIRVPIMTSNTTPEGIASASSDAGPGNEAFQAFDRNGGVEWVAAAGAPQWLQYEFVANTLITDYRLVVLGVSDWTLQGSSDGISFTVLDTQVGVLSGGAFTLAAPGFYLFYRLDVSVSTAPAVTVDILDLRN